MRTPECHQKCRASTGQVNHSYCSIHSCWQCGSRVRFEQSFYIPRFDNEMGYDKHRTIGFCSEKCLAELETKHPNWERT